MTQLPVLPCSLDPLPDESLPGYLLRLAHRLELAPLRVLHLTGLTADSRGGRTSAPRGLMAYLDEAAVERFARTTRLTTTEIAELCMNTMSGRYPWAAPAITSDPWGPRSVISPWVFTAATRYCPQCLAGDGSPIQQEHGGAWRRIWRLPIVFACPLHHRLLEHLCPSCDQPAMSVPPGSSTSLIPRIRNSGLHPLQCRATLRQAGSPHGRSCGARLDMPARTSDAGTSPGLGDLLALQKRLLSLLNPDGPATVTSVGQPATTIQYFADLRLVCSLINGTWPASRHLISTPELADAVDRHIAGANTTRSHHYRLYDAPPLDPQPSVGLIAAAAHILNGDDLRVLGGFFPPTIRDGANRKSPRGRWIRRYQRAGHQCSDGFRESAEPLIDTYQRADQRPHGRRTPAREINFGPEHIPEQLQDDWFSQHFRHIDRIRPRLLRRAAALHLVQMAAGGTLAEAAAFLHIDHRYLTASAGTGFAATACWTTEAGPAEFRIAVHALARQLNTTSNLIDYRLRREALQTWSINPETWQTMTDQLPRTKGPFQPEISDCKRQFASEAVWARITQGEHVLAPRIIEDQLSHTDPTWNRRRANMWHFYLADQPKPHYAALKQILNAHADDLAAVIDQRSR